MGNVSFPHDVCGKQLAWHSVACKLKSYRLNSSKEEEAKYKSHLCCHMQWCCHSHLATTPGMSQQSRRVTCNAKHHCPKKTDIPHTKHSLQNHTFWERTQLENTSKTPGMEQFVLGVIGDCGWQPWWAWDSLILARSDPKQRQKETG